MFFWSKPLRLFWNVSDQKLDSGKAREQGNGVCIQYYVWCWLKYQLPLDACPVILRIGKQFVDATSKSAVFVEYYVGCLHTDANLKCLTCNKYVHCVWSVCVGANWKNVVFGLLCYLGSIVMLYLRGRNGTGWKTMLSQMNVLDSTIHIQMYVNPIQFFVQWWILKWEGMYPWVCTQYCNALCSGHLTSSTHIWSASLKTSLYVSMYAQTQRGCSGCWQAEVAVWLWDFNIGNSIKQSSRQLPSCFLLFPHSSMWEV